MPRKYVIHTKTAPHRVEPITKSGVIAWEEGCLKCAVCVKKRCVYKVYENRRLDPKQMVDSVDNQCMNCLRCVQGCPKELIHKSTSPQYKALGDSHYTPEIIAKLWYQAETGKIPVSGAGYPGPFSGEGFDAMWTDMSEIVRPTRDGIHGREYISTAVDIGKTLKHLTFEESGGLSCEVPPLLKIPLPIVMKAPSFGSVSGETLRGWAMAARRLGTFLILPEQEMKGSFEEAGTSVIPLISATAKPRQFKSRIVEIPWSEGWDEKRGAIEKIGSTALMAAHLPLVQGVEETACRLVKSGVYLLHVEASYNGTAFDNGSRFLKDGIRSIHRALVEQGLRDEVTLLAGGGIAMAEHVAKAIICGADAVVIDFPILIALECRMCRRCAKGLSCPVGIQEASAPWVASRTINLLGAWHNQLLEVMGAMGIRDARRLRGEVGRAMFFEDLDEATFGLFAEVKEGFELE
jgi:ferredoxin